MTEISKQTMNTMVQNVIQNELSTRIALSAILGKSYGGTRDLYSVLGYPTTLTYEQYASRYFRQDVAARVVNAPVEASWRKTPIVTDLEKDSGKTSQFTDTWQNLVRVKKVYRYMERADKLAGIGRYSVLFMGFNDGADTESPVASAKELLYLSVYSELNATITTWDTDVKSERFGLPLIYSLNTSQEGRGKTSTIRVHYSRILHIVQDPLEDDIYGTPVLENIYNRLQDTELISGGSAEMFWRGAFPGYNFKLDPEASITPQSLDLVKDEIQKLMHGLTRYIRTQGISAEALATQIEDPSNHLDVQISLISAATGIPKRILMGSERGELASSQDQKEWNDRVEERRTNVCENAILRPFIDSLVKVGVLPKAQNGTYSIDWPPLQVFSEKDKAEVAEKRTNSLTKYASTPGADIVCPPELYLKKYMDFDDDEIKQVTDSITTSQDEQDEEERLLQEEQDRMKNGEEEVI